MSENIWQPKPTNRKCPTCGSLGFLTSPLGATRCTYCDGTEGGHPPTIGDCADRITALEAENAKLRADMHTAMNAVADASRARGEAEGKLAASETYGVLEGWIEKCAALESKLAKAVKLALEECPFVYGTGSYNDWWHERRVALAELTGGKDE